MGVWLTYETIGPVAPRVAARIVDEAGRVGDDRAWTSCEGLRFDPIDVSRECRLVGGSKVLIPAAPIAPGDGPDDLHVLADALCRWSLAHHLSWQLSISGAPIGTIVGGKAEEGLRAKLDTLSGSLPMPEPARSLAPRAARAIEGRPRLRIYRGPE